MELLSTGSLSNHYRSIDTLERCNQVSRAQTKAAPPEKAHLVGHSISTFAQSPNHLIGSGVLTMSITPYNQLEIVGVANRLQHA